MAYDHYRDSNGVTWTVGPPDAPATGNPPRWTMYAYVPDEAQVKYDPPPTDVMASTPAPADFGRGIPNATAEQVRVIFTELVALIEAYARTHAGAVVMTVTAAPEGGLGWLLLVWLAYEALSG